MGRIGAWCAVVGSLLALTACGVPGTDPAPETRTTLSGAYVGDPALLPMAVSLVVVEPEAGPTAVPAGAPPALGTSQVIELAPGRYALATAILPENGAFELDLPFASELPDALRVPAPDAPAGVLPAGCTVQASSATVSVTPFEVTTPLGANLVYGFTPAGPRILALTPSVVNWADPALDTFTLLQWVHADGPVTFVSVGTCSTASLDYVVDLELARGWNRAGRRFDVLGGGRSARTIAIDDGALVFVSPFAL
ncbi:MAG: hypothetical protein P1P87_13305 [Trueperaceae bacterium]|nr:hypothetical protein [Trueperaceae bacterium]